MCAKLIVYYFQNITSRVGKRKGMAISGPSRDPTPKIQC